VASRGGGSQPSPREAGAPPPGTTTRMRGVRCDRSGRNAGEGKRGPGAQNRHGASAERRASPRDARRLARRLACRVTCRPTGLRGPVRLSALRHPFTGVARSQKAKPGRKNAPRERRNMRCLTSEQDLQTTSEDSACPGCDAARAPNRCIVYAGPPCLKSRRARAARRARCDGPRSPRESRNRARRAAARRESRPPCSRW
jgi:hypothetical protein